MSQTLTTFIYDAARQGYDTALWKALTGTPSASSSKLRFTSAAGIHYGDILRGEATFALAIPSSPSAGEDRRWGFYGANSTEFIGFNISGSTFVAQVDTATTVSTTLTWNTDWDAAEVLWKIVWEPGIAKFYINGVNVATISESTTVAAPLAMPKGPLSLYVQNQEADNMDLGSVTVATYSYV